MSKKNKIEILVEDDDLAAIDNALDAAVDNLVGVNERIRELLDSIEPPPPQKEGQEAGAPEAGAPETVVADAISEATTPEQHEATGDESVTE